MCRERRQTGQSRRLSRAAHGRGLCWGKRHDAQTAVALDEQLHRTGGAPGRLGEGGFVGEVVPPNLINAIVGRESRQRGRRTRDYIGDNYNARLGVVNAPDDAPAQRHTVQFHHEFSRLGLIARNNR